MCPSLLLCPQQWLSVVMLLLRALMMGARQVSMGCGRQPSVVFMVSWVLVLHMLG